MPIRNCCETPGFTTGNVHRNYGKDNTPDPLSNAHTGDRVWRVWIRGAGEYRFSK
jgi:hypothetical protein